MSVRLMANVSGTPLAVVSVKVEPEPAKVATGAVASSLAK